MMDEITGYWVAESKRAPGEEEHLFIDADGRHILQVILPPTERDMKLPMMLWCTQLNDTDYEVRASPSSDSWQVKMYRDGGDLIIKHKEHEPSRWQTISETALPDVFVEPLEVGHARMDARELEAKTPTPDNA